MARSSDCIVSDSSDWDNTIERGSTENWRILPHCLNSRLQLPIASLPRYLRESRYIACFILDLELHHAGQF